MTQRPGPADYNRPAAPARQEVTECPLSLRWAYWVFVVAAVVMLVSVLAAVFGPSDIDSFTRTNRTFVAVTNGIGAVALVFAAALLPRGSGRARILAAVVVALVSFCDVAAVAIGVGGMALVAIPVLLVAGTYLMFRPAANAFVRQAR